MKNLIGILFVMTAATTGCVSDTDEADEVSRITCVPSEASCASDPRIVGARGTLEALGVDLSRTVDVTRVNASSADEALMAAGELDAASEEGSAARFACEIDGPEHGGCCWEQGVSDGPETNYWKCVFW